MLMPSVEKKSHMYKTPTSWLFFFFFNNSFIAVQLTFTGRASFVGSDRDFGYSISTGFFFGYTPLYFGMNRLE